MPVLGASGCNIEIFEERVEKTGPKDMILSQKLAYERLSQLLGLEYPSFFPQVLELRVASSQATLVLERIGETDLEQQMFRAKNLADFELLQKALELSFKKILKFHELTLSQDREEGKLFLRELFSYWRFKSRALKDDESLVLLDELKGFQGKLINEFMVSACHRDFGTYNLIFTSNNQIKFIDPHLVLPGVKLKRISVSSPVRDWATLAINLERRIFEAGFKSKELHDVLVVSLGKLQEIVLNLIDQKWFSHRFWELNKLIVYLSRASCDCQFCSKELRQYMAGQAGKLLPGLRTERDRC